MNDTLFVAGDAAMLVDTRSRPLATRYFKWRSMSILGGSNMIQRNVVAKAVLGIR